MSKLMSALCLLTAVAATAAPSYACTSFRVKTQEGHVFYGRTLEGQSYDSSISIVPKGTAYVGTLPDGKQNGLKWTTKYGVVGMNACGLPQMIDGINDRGLAAGNLFFPGYADYQPFDRRQTGRTIAQYEVITWILSNFATVAEVKEGIRNIRVCRVQSDLAGDLPLHYTIHDPQGNSLVIEYVKGELTVYDNPIGVMTNSPTLDWHLTNLRNYLTLSPNNAAPITIDGIRATGFGQGNGMWGLPGDYSPPSRFVRMAVLVHTALPVKGYDEGLNLTMTILNNIDIAKGSVREPSGKTPEYDITNWSVAVDLGQKKYYYRRYFNKDWRCVDVTKALRNAKGIMTISIDQPAAYKDVTDAAAPYTVPKAVYPNGTP
jgi:choloylglycine hydrolase